MKKLFIVFGLILAVFLCACKRNSKTTSHQLSSTRVVKNAKEVTMVITDGEEQDSQHLKAIKAVISNNSSIKLSLGEEFYIDMLYQDVWQEVTFDSVITVKPLITVLEPGDEIMKDYWINEAFTEVLDPGCYRIVVQLAPENDSAEYVTAEFTVK